MHVNTRRKHAFLIACFCSWRDLEFCSGKLETEFVTVSGLLKYDKCRPNFVLIEKLQLKLWFTCQK